MLDWFKRIGAPAVAESTKPAPAAETKVDRLADRLEAIAKAEHAAHSHRPEVKVMSLKLQNFTHVPDGMIRLWQHIEGLGYGWISLWDHFWSLTGDGCLILRCAK